MRIVVLGAVFLLVATGASHAQGETPAPAVPDAQKRAADEEARAAEIRAQQELARARQRRVDRQNTDLWQRWTYAVCLGCGPVPRNARRVHTHPMRVLAGIWAADDDARERRGTLRI